MEKYICKKRLDWNDINESVINLFIFFENQIYSSEYICDMFFQNDIIYIDHYINKYFITLNQYRKQRIDEIFKD